MDLKKYLLDTFGYNNYANRLVLEKIKILPEKTTGIELFSHLINSQFKWLARINQEINTQTMDWWKPVYPLDKLETKWEESLTAWTD